MFSIGLFRVAVSDRSGDITKYNLLPWPLGWRKLPFDGGFEDGGFVAFEVGFDALEISDGFVESGELLFDLRNDAALLFSWCDRNFKA